MSMNPRSPLPWSVNMISVSDPTHVSCWFSPRTTAPGISSTLPNRDSRSSMILLWAVLPFHRTVTRVNSLSTEVRVMDSIAPHPHRGVRLYRKTRCVSATWRFRPGLAARFTCSSREGLSGCVRSSTRPIYRAGRKMCGRQHAKTTA